MSEHRSQTNQRPGVKMADDPLASQNLSKITWNIVVKYYDSKEKVMQ